MLSQICYVICYAWREISCEHSALFGKVMPPAHHESPWMTDETRVFREAAREFIEKELVPHQPKCAEQGGAHSLAWSNAGRIGLLLPDVPEQYGGGGGTFAHE